MKEILWFQSLFCSLVLKTYLNKSQTLDYIFFLTDVNIVLGKSFLNLNVLMQIFRLQLKMFTVFMKSLLKAKKKSVNP